MKKVKMFSCFALIAIFFLMISFSSTGVVSAPAEEAIPDGTSFTCPDDADRMLKMTGNSLTVHVGKQIRLVPEIMRLKEEAPHKSSLEWHSEDESIAIVSKNGNVKGINPGTVTISCCLADRPDIEASARIHIIQPVKSIKPSSDKIALYIGASDSAAQEKLSVTVEPENASIKDCAFSSSDEAVVTVDAYGNLRAVGPGNARITIVPLEEGSKVKAVCTVSVGQAVSSISVPSSQAMNRNTTYALKPTVLPENAAMKKLEYVSSDPSVATVSPTGVVKAVDCGTAIITAKAMDGSEVSAECKITVTQMVSGIKLNKTSLTMDYNTTYDLTAKVLPEDATNPRLRWTSSDPTVVTVTNGSLKALGVGSATITCSATDQSGVKKTVNVKVTYRTKSKNTLSNGTPLGGPYKLEYSTKNELQSGKVEIHSLTVQKLNNSYLRFSFSYTAPAGYGISAFSPPNGQFYMVIPKNPTRSGSDTVQFEIHEDDFLASAYFTMKFFGRTDQFWVFPTIDSKLKQYLKNPSSIPIPASTPQPTPRVTEKPSSSTSNRSKYMSDSDLKELAIFYFGLYGGNKNSITLTDISCKGNDAVVLIAYGGGHVVGILMDRTTGEYKGMKKGR